MELQNSLKVFENMSKRNNKAKATPNMDPHMPNGKNIDKEAAEQQNEKEISIEQEAEQNEEIPVNKGKSKKGKSADSAANKLEMLQKELEETKIKLTESEGYALRLNADFANMRKRKEKEMSELIKYSHEDLLKQLLPVLDSFDRAMEAMDKSDNLAAIKEGIHSLSRQLNNILTKIGLESIESIGESFSSEIHEAITAVPVEDEEQKGKVIDEIEKGYRLKEKIIRFPKVIVGE